MLTDASLRNQRHWAIHWAMSKSRHSFNAYADTLLEVEQETVRNLFADVMTEALIDALPRQLAKH